MIVARIVITLVGFRLLGGLGAFVGFLIGTWIDNLLKTVSDFWSLSKSSPELRRSLLEAIRARMGLFDADLSHALDHPILDQPLAEAYQQLGVHMDATNAAIKEQYRRLMNQYHPDKLSSKGLGVSMLQVAQEKTQRIRHAYDLIREKRNFR
jgi:DnaJ-domain-containing protein 1